jgi:hypothetical protein
MIATALVSILSMWFANSYFKGKIISTLPFEPWSMVSNMSHRSIEGNDMR